MARLERLHFEPLGRGHWTATYKGHVYEIEGHPDRGYVIFRDGECRYPYAINTLRMAEQIADDIAEFDAVKRKVKKVAKRGSRSGSKRKVKKATKRGSKKNPIYRLKVTASTEAKAKTRARRFGRVVHVQHQGGDKYNVTVDQPKMGNPRLPEVAISSGMGGPPIKLTTDKEIREHLQELREELREDRAEFRHALPRMRQRAAKMPFEERMMEHGDFEVGSYEMGEIEVKEDEIRRLEDALKKRQAIRKTEREVKKPLKTPVMRRRKGVVSQINPKSSERVKNVRDIVRKAMK